MKKVLLPALLILGLLGSGFFVLKKFSGGPRNHPATDLQSWAGFKDTPLLNRIRPAPAEIVDYITKDNISNSWPDRPVSAPLSQDYKSDFIVAFRDLPEKLKTKLSEKVVGIFLVRGLGGSAYTEAVWDRSARVPVAGFIVLDVSAMDRTANEWATWKENSPFRSDPHHSVVAEIEKAENNNRKNALQYILLHEFGHVLSIGLGQVAPFGIPVEKLGGIQQFGFSSLSWKIRENHFESIFDENFAQRGWVKYYSFQKSYLSPRAAPDLYKRLAETNFPTLYAATNPFDDFAESFATYVHSVVLKKPWTIQIQTDGETVETFNLCWNTTRCEAKQKMLEDLLSRE